jgi:hypothetical protein
LRLSVFVQGVLWFSGFFNLHVPKLLGVKDLATLQALDELGVFVPGNDTYPGMLADGCHRFGFGRASFRKIVAVFEPIWNGFLLNLCAGGEDSCRLEPKRFPAGLENPTEMVVY